jgi:hypothetical protein
MSIDEHRQCLLVGCEFHYLKYDAWLCRMHADPLLSRGLRGLGKIDKELMARLKRLPNMTSKYD